jgi:DNA repair protein RadC
LPDEDKNFYTGHRERLREKFIDNKLADYEKLELLLGYAIPRRDVRPLARSLVKHFGGVYQVLTASIDDLVAFNGIGRNTAVFIKLVQQMMQIGFEGQLKENPIFHNESVLHNYCRVLLTGKQIEEMHVLYLDSNLKLIADDLHTTGTVDSSVVYPHEIARRALQLNARSVVMVHNHPTSINSFSNDDLEATEQVNYALESLDIKLYDHLLVVGDNVLSMRALHMI